MKTAPKKEIEAYAHKLIDGILSWYMTGAVDCKETRDNINKELEKVLPAVEKKFRLKPIKRVLRVWSDGKGWLTVRAESPSAN